MHVLLKRIKGEDWQVAFKHPMPKDICDVRIKEFKDFGTNRELKSVPINLLPKDNYKVNSFI